MSEKPLDLNKEREYRIRRIVTAIENMVAALSDDRYEIIWLNEGDFSLRQFAFTLEIPEIEDIVDRRGLFSMGAQLLELPELEDYLLRAQANGLHTFNL